MSPFQTQMAIDPHLRLLSKARWLCGTVASVYLDRWILVEVHWHRYVVCYQEPVILVADLEAGFPVFTSVNWLAGHPTSRSL